LSFRAVKLAARTGTEPVRQHEESVKQTGATLRSPLSDSALEESYAERRDGTRAPRE
jgi:hypothetical protein